MAMVMYVVDGSKTEPGGGEEKVEDKSDDALSSSRFVETEDTSTAAPTTTGTSDGMSDSQLFSRP